MSRTDADRRHGRGTGARRIRSIKPEIAESETLGRVSRDARWLFVLLWTRADDAGRLAGDPKLLARTLFPFDDDALALIDGWLAELMREGHVTGYDADGRRYLAIPKWLEHQKIDRPSPSRLPAPPDDGRESSRGLANPREGSREVATDRESSRTLAPDPYRDQDQDPDRDQERDQDGARANPREASRILASDREDAAAVAPMVSRRALVSSGLPWARQHSEHEAGFCGWVCLPSDLVSQFAARLAAARSGCDIPTPVDVEAARLDVLTWAGAVREKFTAAGRVPTGRMYDFWNARWSEEFGAETSTGRPDALAGVRAALAAGGRS